MPIIILIPKILPEPKFDLVDIETGIEREITKDEKAQLLAYEESCIKYNKCQKVISGWFVSGTYEDIINQRRSSTVYKDGIPWLLATLTEDRAKPLKDVKTLNLELTDGIVVSVPDIRDWLAKEGYFSKERCEEIAAEEARQAELAKQADM